jgi:hypothetical protein
LNKRITDSFEQLLKFKTHLQQKLISGWSSYDVQIGEGLSAQDRVQQSVQYLQQVCVSQHLLGKFAREYSKVKQIFSATFIQQWYRPKYRRMIQTVIFLQAVGRGYNTHKQMNAKKCQQEPSTEIETRPGTPVTPATPPQKQPEQSTALVVVVSPVSKPRAPTRAGARVSKPSVLVDEERTQV